jgi:hypothetical protein
MDYVSMADKGISIAKLNSQRQRIQSSVSNQRVPNAPKMHDIYHRKNFKGSDSNLLMADGLASGQILEDDLRSMSVNGLDARSASLTDVVNGDIEDEISLSMVLEIMRSQRRVEAQKENERESNLAVGEPGHKALLKDFYGPDGEVENEGSTTGRALDYQVNLALDGCTQLEPEQEQDHSEPAKNPENPEDDKPSEQVNETVLAARAKTTAMRKEKIEKRKFDEKISKPFAINPIQNRIRL